MVRKIFGPLFVIVLLVSVAVASSFAVVKGLESSKQSIIKVGESITIPQGADVKSVVSVGGSVTVYGTVDQDVVSVGGSVFLKDSAVVGGDTVSVGGKVMKEAGALAKGDVVEVSAGGISPAVSYFTKGGILKGLALFGLLTFIGFIILAIILVAVFTPQLGIVSAALEKNLLRSFLIGLLVMILFIPIIIVLAVSIVGIILIPVWLILVGAACLFGYITAGHLLGKKTLHAFRLFNKSMMTETLTGVILLSVVGLVPIGGFIIKMIAVLCGLGGVSETRFGTK
ncbi:MAG: hypothetical protein PHG97_02375 [Candidatus Margulisbacteria bacterium]|nr:hypothetical protein [Candidatus Margulisiibacteriota bacterium]